ncbi:MAG TPA: hypothetical protein EYH16_05050, partial [Leucothrix mucor]|nr:hypothetical protein [Leucothrix mucor]
MKFLAKVTSFFCTSKEKSALTNKQHTPDCSQLDCNESRRVKTVKEIVTMTVLLCVSLGLSPQVFAENLSLITYFGKTGGIAGDGSLNAVGNVVNGRTICASNNTNANNEAGCDMSDDPGYQKNDPNNPDDDTYTGDLVVRTNDQFEVIAGWSVTGGNEPVTLTSVLPNNMVRWGALPSSCKAGSSVSEDGLTLVCVRSNYTAASAYSEDTPFNVIVTGNTPNGTSLGDISFTINSDNGTAVSDNVGASITATAKPRWNLDHHSIYTYGSGLTFNGVVGQYIEYKYYLEVDEVAGETDTTSAVLGNESLGTDFTLEFDQILSSVSPNAQLISCHKNHQSSDNPLAYYSPKYPWRSVKTPYATMKQTCTQAGGPGTPIHVKHEHIDASLSHIPTETYVYHNAIPATRAFAAIGTIRVFIPNTDITTGTNATDTTGANELRTRSVVTSFDPVSVSGQSNFGSLSESTKDNTYTRTLYGSRGSYSIHYTENLTRWAQSTAGGNTGYRAGNGVITPGTSWTARLNYYNSGGELLTGGKNCVIFDSNTVDVTDIPATPGHAVAMHYNSGGTNAEVGAVFEYATGYVGGSWPPSPNASHADRIVQECGDSNITWHSTTTAAKAVGPITKVRVRFTNGVPAGRNTYSIVNLTARSNDLAGQPLTSGTIIPMYGSLTDDTFFTASRYPATNGWYPSSYQPKSSYSDPHSGYPGDRILLVRAKVRVSKEISQTNASTGDTIDLTLKPTFTCDGTTTENAVVKVTEMLDEGLVYKAGSSSIGDPIVGSCADLEAGALKTACTASHTVLIWNLGTKTCNTVIPDITYSTQVDAGAPVGTLHTYTMVSSPVDTSPLSIRTENKNTSIAIPTALILTKSTSDSYYDIDDQLKYTVNVRNGTSTTLNNMQMIDILPFNGDGTAGYKLTMGLNTTIEKRNPPSAFAGTVSYLNSSLTAGCAGTPAYEFTNASPSSIDISPVAASNTAGGSTTWCAGTATGPAASCGFTNNAITAVRVKGITLGASALCRININLATTGQNKSAKQQFSNTSGAYAQGVSLPTISNLVHIAGEQPVAVNDSKTNPNPSLPSNPTSQDVTANDTDPAGSVTINKATVNFDPASVTGGTGTDTDGDGDIDKVVVAGQGTWTVDANGIVTFTPAPGFDGSPTPLSYVITASNGFQSSSATIAVQYPVIQPPAGMVCSNEPPVALNITAGNIDTSGSVDANSLQVGEYVTYTNAATYNGSSVDVRMTLLANPGNITVDLHGNTYGSGSTAIYYPIFLEGTNTDNAVSIQYSTYIAGTTTRITVPFGLTIKDIDNEGTHEGVEFSDAAIQSYTLSATPASNISIVSNTQSLLGQSGNYTLFTNTVTSAGNTEQEHWVSTFHGKTDFVVANLKKRDGTTGYLFTPDLFTDPATTVSIACAPLAGTISGSVKDTSNNGIGSVTVEIHDASGNVVNDANGNALTTTTANDGSYSFSDVPVGDYTIVEIDPAGYTSTTDGDSSADGDVSTNTSQTDNTIPVTITHGKNDTDNNFVDSLPPVATDDTKANNGVPSITNTTTLTAVGDNDNDPDGTIDNATVDLDPTTTGIQNSYSTADGDWAVTPAGDVTFTPKASFIGTTASTPYTINDNHGNVSNEATLTVTYIAMAPSFTVDKATVSTPTQVGDTLLYKFTVVNNGNVPLTAVT